MGPFQISQRFDLDMSGSFRKCPLLEHHHHQEKPIEWKKCNLCGRQYSGLNPGKYMRYAVLCHELT